MMDYFYVYPMDFEFSVCVEPKIISLESIYKLACSLLISSHCLAMMVYCLFIDCCLFLFVVVAIVGDSRAKE